MMMPLPASPKAEHFFQLFLLLNYEEEKDENHTIPTPDSQTTGYTSLTWLLVAHLACSGLIVAWLLKYSDSITKIQATSASLFLTAIVSAAWLGTVISVNMIVGMIFVAFSMFMYHGLFPNAA